MSGLSYSQEVNRKNLYQLSFSFNGSNSHHLASTYNSANGSSEKIETQKMNNSVISSGNNFTTSPLTAAINECFNVTKELINDRKQIENHLTVKYQQNEQSYRNVLDIYRLPPKPTGIERLVKEQKSGRAYIVMLLVRMEDAFGTCKAITDVRNQINTWADVITYLSILRYVERELMKKGTKTPLKLMKELTSAVKNLTKWTVEIRNSLWFLGGLIDIKIN